MTIAYVRAKIRDNFNIYVIRGDIISTFYVPDGDKSIESWTYVGNNFRRIFIPASVEVISHHTFSWAWYIERVYFTDGLKEIGDYAFERTAIYEIILPDTLKKIGQSAFKDCHNLFRVIIPHGVEDIGPYAFENTGITSITIPGTVETISSYLFYECRKLKEISFEPGVKNIERRFISGNNNLSKVVIPATIEKVDFDAFGNCLSIHKLVFTATNNKIASHVIDDLNFILVKNVEIPCNYTFYDGFICWYLARHPETTITLNYTSFEELYTFFHELINSDNRRLGIRMRFFCQGPQFSGNEMLKLGLLTSSNIELCFDNSYVKEAIFNCGDGQIDKQNTEMLGKYSGWTITFKYQSEEELESYLFGMSYDLLTALKRHRVIFKGPKYNPFFNSVIWKLIGIDYTFHVDYSLKRVKK